MKNLHLAPWILATLAVCSFTMAGCVTASSPTRFFTLNAFDSLDRGSGSYAFQPAEIWPSRPSPQAIVVAVGPVTIPESVNRPEIVTQDSAHQISIHDMERWAGPLDKKVLRVLTDDLDAKLASEKFTVVAWDPSTQVNVEARYRVMVEVTRFELSKEPGAARFDADWVLYGPQDKVLAMRQTRRRAAVAGTGVKALVAAMSQCIMEFSNEVAETISSAEA